MEVRIEAINSKEEYNLAKDLFMEYSCELGIDLKFQGFESELENIHKIYCPPHGVLLLLSVDERLAGCAGIRMFEGKIAELKRMFVKSAFRGHGYGKLLLQRAIGEAKKMRYKQVRLDTLPNMGNAMHLYEKIGFREIPAYRFNPIVGAKYYELLIFE
jgi:GNAT superfamily N-acetyltransferase